MEVKRHKSSCSSGNTTTRRISQVGAEFAPAGQTRAGAARSGRRRVEAGGSDAIRRPSRSGRAGGLGCAQCRVPGATINFAHLQMNAPACLPSFLPASRSCIARAPRPARKCARLPPAERIGVATGSLRALSTAAGRTFNAPLWAASAPAWSAIGELRRRRARN